MVKYARKFPGDVSPVNIAAVATGFPSGQYPLRTKLEEARRTVADGADEIDMVIDRCAFLAGDHAKVFDEIAATKEACGAFIKTSTGKVSPVATMPVTLVMLEAIRDYFFATGIRTSKQALAYLVMVKETLGDDWLNPQCSRFGASTFVNDVLMQIVKNVEGNYQGSDHFSLS
jgi:deoxyribose-phosphate aldolase